MEQHRVAHAGRPMNKSTRTADPLALTLIVLGALLCLGASFTREQIEEVKDIVGTWKGAYAEDGGERVILIISENGAYGGRAGKAPLKGTLRIFSGNLEYQETGSQRITFSLYERGKQRLLRGFDEAGEFKLSLKLVKRRAKPGTLALEDTRFITIAATAAPTSDPKASSAQSTASSPLVSCRTFISERDVDKAFYRAIKDIKVSKKWYGSTSEMDRHLVKKARKMEADAVINVRTWHAPAGFAWSAPHAGGLAVKWTEAGHEALPSLKGRCY